MKQAPPVWKTEQLPLKAAWSVAVSTEDVRCYTQTNKYLTRQDVEENCHDYMR